MAVLPDVVRGCVRNPERPYKIYFFAGDRYWRYDLRRAYGEVNYPLPMGEWKFGPPFASGIDAVVDRKGSSPQVTYFFKGDRYLSYDWGTETVVGEESISAWQIGAPGFAAGVDAAVNGEGAYAGKTYFFKGAEYLRYNWNDNTISGPAPIAAWNLGPGFEADLTACFTEVEFGRPKTYFFKQGRYVRYDWGHDRADAGYPRPTSAGWPSGLAVWAEHTGAPLFGCADARLEGGEDRLLGYPDGTPKGQAGWQLGLRFTDPANLAATLEGTPIPEFCGDDDAGSGKVVPGMVTRLGLVAGGAPGSFDTAAGRDDPGGRLTPSTVKSPSLRANLERIGKMLEPGAPIVLFGADCARGPDGDELLEALSDVWADHPVTGFTRDGHAGAGRQRRPGALCDNPGLRAAGQSQVWLHEDLNQHRKAALNGGIVDVHP
jgi:Hemopexin